MFVPIDKFFLLNYRTKLYVLSKCVEVQEFVRYVDYRFYQNLVSVLVPDVLRPIPSKSNEVIYQRIRVV